MNFDSSVVLFVSILDCSFIEVEVIFFDSLVLFNCSFGSLVNLFDWDIFFDSLLVVFLVSIFDFSMGFMKEVFAFLDSLILFSSLIDFLTRSFVIGSSIKKLK